MKTFINSNLGYHPLSAFPLHTHKNTSAVQPTQCQHNGHPVKCLSCWNLRFSPVTVVTLLWKLLKLTQSPKTFQQLNPICSKIEIKILALHKYCSWQCNLCLMLAEAQHDIKCPISIAGPHKLMCRCCSDNHKLCSVRWGHTVITHNRSSTQAYMNKIDINGKMWKRLLRTEQLFYLRQYEALPGALLFWYFGHDNTLHITTIQLHYNQSHKYG